MPEGVYEVHEVGNVVAFADDQLEEFVPAVDAPSPRKAVQRAKGRTGRSAFVDPICKEHPDWEDESGTVTIADGISVHCAKFAHLPGKGRGVQQPGIWDTFKSTTSEFVKPLLLLSLLGIAFFVLQHFLGGGLGGVLRPDAKLCESNRSVSVRSGSAPAVSPSPVSSGDSCGTRRGTNFLHVDPSVSPK